MAESFALLSRIAAAVPAKRWIEALAAAAVFAFWALEARFPAGFPRFRFAVAADRFVHTFAKGTTLSLRAKGQPPAIAFFPFFNHIVITGRPRDTGALKAVPRLAIKTRFITFLPLVLPAVIT
jgi:hypothetical protein